MQRFVFADGYGDPHGFALPDVVTVGYGYGIADQFGDDTSDRYAQRYRHSDGDHHRVGYPIADR